MLSATTFFSELFDDGPFLMNGDYIDYPRGRVIWDTTNNRAIIYIDPCIRNEDVLGKVVDAFEVEDYVVSEDDHYHCRRCVGRLFK